MAMEEPLEELKLVNKKKSTTSITGQFTKSFQTKKKKKPKKKEGGLMLTLLIALSIGAYKYYDQEVISLWEKILTLI